MQRSAREGGGQTIPPAPPGDGKERPSVAYITLLRECGEGTSEPTILVSVGSGSETILPVGVPIVVVHDPWRAASDKLRLWCAHAPEGDPARPAETGSPVDFKLTFSNGQMFQGTYWLLRSAMEDADLSQAVQRTVRVYAGAQCPPGWSPAQYRTFLQSNAEMHDLAIEMLYGYDLGPAYQPPLGEGGDGPEGASPLRGIWAQLTEMEKGREGRDGNDHNRDE